MAKLAVRLSAIKLLCKQCVVICMLVVGCNIESDRVFSYVFQIVLNRILQLRGKTASLRSSASQFLWELVAICNVQV